MHIILVQQLDLSFVFLDEAHIRGTDLRLLDHYRGRIIWSVVSELRGGQTGSSLSEVAPPSVKLCMVTKRRSLVQILEVCASVDLQDHHVMRLTSHEVTPGYTFSVALSLQVVCHT